MAHLENLLSKPFGQILYFGGGECYDSDLALQGGLIALDLDDLQQRLVDVFMPLSWVMACLPKLYP